MINRTDLVGNTIYLHDKVVRAVMWGRSPVLRIQIVTHISTDGKVYLDNSKQAIRELNRLLVIERRDLNENYKKKI